MTPRLLNRRVRGMLAVFLACSPLAARASLDDYDAVITEDAAGGLTPLARLTTAVTLDGADRVPFDFGPTAADATFEFILEGNPAFTVSSYLAVGANANSNLRYELWNDTGQLGFTELGVMDYNFEPGVPSPTQPAHVTYVWNASARTMHLFLNGELAGSRSGVSPAFAMPRGQGWLGANPQSGETMVGTIQRVTVYDGRVSEEVILAHADAFRSVVRPPVILSFAASPDTVFTPGTVTLTWEVRNALAVFIDGQEVTGMTSMNVSPTATRAYTLLATNAAASTLSEVTVRVNPAPVIHRFQADRTRGRAGETIPLRWEVEFAENILISPGIGDVTAQTAAGIGSIVVQPTEFTTYLLTARSEFGTNTASAEIHIVQPANHLVISEFMANDRSTLPDEEGEFSGWIEIHNPTAHAVNLEGHFLSDDPTRLTRWAFPGTNLVAGGYLVVFASGNNRAQAGAPLHADFRLSNAGEYLALVGPGPSVLHAFAPVFPPQRPDISYGILAGDVALAQFFGIPTPGAVNNETLPPPGPVNFSRSSGMFTEAFPVTLSTLEPDAEIRYSVDGSVPGLTNGFRYTAPIHITNTTRLRAIAIAAGQLSQVNGASYIKLAPDLVGYTSSLPIMVIENFGAGTIRRKGWNSTGAGIKQVPRQAAAWVTFDRTGGTSALSNPPQMISLVGIRGRGAYSTEWRQKPYSVEAMDEAGAEVQVSPLDMPSHADWVLYFPDPEQSRDPTLLFNTFAYELSRNIGHSAVRFRWVEAFINEDGGDLKLADRRGVYALMEKVARGKDRLDFQKLSADGSSGSWLLSINRMDPEPETGWPAPNGATQPWFFHTAGPNRIVETTPNTAYSRVPGDDLPQQSNGYLNFENPNGHQINPSQRAAIEGWFKRFEDVLYNDAIWRDPTDGYQRYLDTLDFANYFILNVLTRNGDGLLISLFPWKGDDDKLRIGPAWDYNWSSYYVSGLPAGSLMHRSEQLWYPRLFADPDFKQLYIDRWWQLRRGPMSNPALRAIVDGQSSEITPEKALLNGLPSAAEWSRRLTQMKSWLTERADWIDSHYLRPPVFNPDAGEVPPDFAVVLSGPGGTVYLTTDGTDPRAPGGGIANSAQAYAGPFSIRAQTFVKARVKNGANWSGLSAAVFAPPQDLTRLVITEIMYDPPPAGAWTSEDLEFLELKNTGTNSLQLGAFQFTSGIEFAFANEARLEPGQFFLLARNVTAMEAIYPGVVVNGVFTGRLNNSGESLRLATPWGVTALEMTYSDRAPWPGEAAGLGFSLVPRSTNSYNSSDGTDWRASTARGGSPGAGDPPPAEVPCRADGAPLIVAHPLDQTVLAGAYVSLSVAVTNAAALPIQYRWQRNGEDLPGGLFLLEDKVCFLTVTNAQSPFTRYSVHVSNPACPDGFTSAVATLSFAADADGDGQPDEWESLYGLSSADPADATLDRDGDGMRNWQEYVAGTDPTDPASCLRIDAVEGANGAGAVVRFLALANRTYALEFTDHLETEPWARLADLFAQPFDREEAVHDPGFRPNRFYRLATPRTP